MNDLVFWHTSCHKYCELILLHNNYRTMKVIYSKKDRLKQAVKLFMKVGFVCLLLFVWLEFVSGCNELYKMIICVFG